VETAQLSDAEPVGLRRAWPSSARARELLRLYAFRGPLTRLEYRLRLTICPFEEVARHVPHDASVLELGCGYGMLANLVALDAPSRGVVGIDAEPTRVAVAQRSTRGRANVRFDVGDVTTMALPGADCVAMNDLLHHIPHVQQIPLLEKCYAALPKGGLLLIKDVDKSSLLKYVWNYAHDLIKNRWLPFYCLDTPILVAILQLVGFRVEVQRLDAGYPYSHVLYRCTK
jgi:SAM-dependent methyltransferase